MIPRIQTGTSFKGAALYYLHDKRLAGEDVRLTAGRVAWTYALNTLEEEPEAVLAEMQQTAFDQQLLKQLSGNRMDGRPTERPVMTVALAWAPNQSPTREEMIETGRSFLKGMGWDEHQALFVGHDDTKHPHFHMIVNRVHPETGMTIDDNWSKRRAQRWALAYEREHGEVLCRAREAKYGREEPRAASHMNYREWQAWQEIAKENALDPDTERALQAGEWHLLRQAHKHERTGFWRETSRIRKELRTSLREQVREEFAGEWQDYALLKEERMEQAAAYDAKARREMRGQGKAGAAKIKERQAEYHAGLREELAGMRADVSDRQKARLEELLTPALEQLSKDRLAAYQDVLARHRAEKAQLADDQAEGTRRHDLLGRYYHSERATPQNAERSEETQARQPRGRRFSMRDKRDAFYERFEKDARESAPGEQRDADSGTGRDPLGKPPRRDAADLVAGAGLALIGKLADSLETLFDTPPPPASEQDNKTMPQDQEQTPPREPQDGRPTPNQLEEEKRRKEDMDFYLEQRRKERYHDYDRGR